MEGMAEALDSEDDDHSSSSSSDDTRDKEGAGPSQRVDANTDGP